MAKWKAEFSRAESRTLALEPSSIHLALLEFVSRLFKKITVMNALCIALISFRKNPA